MLEYFHVTEIGTIEMFRIAAAEDLDGYLNFRLQNEQTAPLAPNRNGLELASFHRKPSFGPHSHGC